MAMCAMSVAATFSASNLYKHMSAVPGHDWRLYLLTVALDSYCNLFPGAGVPVSQGDQLRQVVFVSWTALWSARCRSFIYWDSEGTLGCCLGGSGRDCLAIAVPVDAAADDRMAWEQEA